MRESLISKIISVLIFTLQAFAPSCSCSSPVLSRLNLLLVRVQINPTIFSAVVSGNFDESS